MDLNKLTRVMFNDMANDMQICYHLVYPRNLNLTKRLKKTPQTNDHTVKKRRRRGRPRKEEVQRAEDGRRAPDEIAADDKAVENVVNVPCSRTRSGRVSRPPKHMSKFTTVSATTDNVVPMDTSEPVNGLNVDQQSDATISKVVPEPRKVRKNVDRFTCGGCKKVYLGRKKMLKHHLAFPDHKTPTDGVGRTQNHFNNGLMTNGSNSLLFDELMKVIGRATQTERISIFLAEISNFVSKVRMFKPKILHLDQDPSTSEYYIDKNVSKVFDLPEGMLRLNDRAFDTHSQQNDTAFSTFINERPTDNISSLSNLQQLGYNLNLFPQVNYDQITDNAVEVEVLGKSNGNDTIGDLSHESPILDIPIEMFSFNSMK